MKTKIFFAGACATALLMSCNKDVTIREDAGNVPAETAELCVNIPLENATKAAGAGSESDEKALSSVQVFVFTNSGNIEANKSSDSGSLEISCTKGEKTVAALVNAPALSDVRTLDDLRSRVSLLGDNGRQSFVMYGQKAVSVSAASVSVTLEVQRFAAKVVIGKITNKLELAQYRTTPITIEGIYLINVAGNAVLSGAGTPTLWLNKSKNETQADGLYSETPASLSVEYASSETSAHHFYCYPNPTSEDSSAAAWSPRHTRLVIEATVGGRKYYYPITLPVINPNTVYTVNELTITRLGSDTPDLESVLGSISFDITVAPWKTETVQSVTI